LQQVGEMSFIKKAEGASAKPLAVIAPTHQLGLRRWLFCLRRLLLAARSALLPRLRKG
jgi:hypothetical protein